MQPNDGKDEPSDEDPSDAAAPLLQPHLRKARPQSLTALTSLAAALALLLAPVALYYSTRSSLDSRPSLSALQHFNLPGTPLLSKPSTIAGAPQAVRSRFEVGGASFLAEEPRTRTFDFVVSEGEGAPDGVQKRMILVNGLYPGPTIEVNEFDRVVVNVHNQLDVPTSMHWHGLYQMGTNHYDGSAGITQCGIPPSSYLTYSFNLDGWTGTTWWHAHWGLQDADGVVGAFVVQSRNESVPAYDGDVVVQLSDLYHEGAQSLLEAYQSPQGIDYVPGNEPVPDSVVINGVGQYINDSTSYTEFNFLPSQTYRLRLINTGSFAPIVFSVDHHTLTVIEADGSTVVPYPLSSLELAPAQRYSVLLTTNQSPKAYWMRATMDPRMFRYTKLGMQSVALGVVRYGGGGGDMLELVDGGDPGEGGLDSSLLVPTDLIVPPNATITHMVKVSTQKTSDGATLSFLNSTSWEILQGTNTLLSQLGFDQVGPRSLREQLMITLPTPPLGFQVVDLVVENLDDGDHPFHLHGHKMWVVSTGFGRYQRGTQVLDAGPTLKRDTVYVKAYSYVILRFVANNPGVFAFHCHNAWHMAGGLMMQIISRPEELRLIEIPPIMVSHCQVSPP